MLERVWKKGKTVGGNVNWWVHYGEEYVVTVQSLGCVCLCHPMNYSTPGCPCYLLEIAQSHVHWVSDAIQPAHPLSTPSPLALNLSSIRVFSNYLSLCIRWPKCWSFSCSISLSNEYSGHSGLIFLRNDWLGLLAIQWTLKSLLQKMEISLKESILQHSVFFMVQFSIPYMTTRKTIALTTQTFVQKAVSAF